MKMTPFWYRRVCEIVIFISLIIVAIYAAGTFFGSDFLGGNLVVPFSVVISAAVTTAAGIAAYFWTPQKMLAYVALAEFMIFAFTIGLLVVMTGFTSSAFVAVWLVVAVFSGLFGVPGILSVFALSNGYFLLRLLMVGDIAKEQFFVFFLIAELPLILSYFIWHTRHRHESEKDQAFSALARELHQASSKSDIVINAIADGVVMIDPRGTIQLFNPAAQSILGWTRQDAQGLDYHSVFKLTTKTGAAITPDTDPIQATIRNGTPVMNNELTLTTPAGKKILLSLVVSPVTNAPGSSVILIVRDITSQKLEERQQAEFISTASHEMRTPVAAIEGFLGLALNPATATIDDKARRFLTKAHEATQHLGRLFQDLLDVSKAEDGRLANNPSVTDVGAFIGGVVEGFEARAKEKGLFLYYKNADDESQEGSSARTISPVFYSKIDNDHLSEIVGNLIENAIKYTKQGSVTVDVGGNEKQISISVKDTGFGIPKEDIPHLFQKFYRVDNTDTREIGGTGLGLYLCRRLAEAMGGAITVESDYGKGSAFILTIPRMEGELAITELEKSSDALSNGSGYQSAPAVMPQVAPPSPTTIQSAVAAAQSNTVATPSQPAVMPPIVSAPPPSPSPPQINQQPYPVADSQTQPFHDVAPQPTLQPPVAAPVQVATSRQASTVSIPNRVTLDVLEQQVGAKRSNPVESQKSTNTMAFSDISPYNRR